jgi:DNA-binding XRE family transcriptional regulator
MGNDSDINVCDFDCRQKLKFSHIKKARESAGLTKAELSRLSGISPASISLIEKECRDIRMSTAILLSKALNISLDQLYGITQEKNINNKLMDMRKKLLYINYISDLTEN